MARPVGAVSPTNEQIVEALAQERKAPDVSAPIAMKYWVVPERIGTLDMRIVTVGTVCNDGCGTHGRVKSIWFYPVGGFAIAEVELGFRPGVLDKDQELSIRRLVLSSGSGQVAE